MVTFCMVQPEHIESFLAMDEQKRAGYVGRLAGAWTFRNKAGEMIPLGAVSKLSANQKIELVEQFRSEYAHDRNIQDDQIQIPPESTAIDEGAGPR